MIVQNLKELVEIVENEKALKAYCLANAVNSRPVENGFNNSQSVVKTAEEFYKFIKSANQ